MTTRPLPMKLWLPLEDSVAEHKAAVAKNFAEARARLLPEPWKVPKPPSLIDDWRAAYLQAAAAKSPWHAWNQVGQNNLMQALGFEGACLFPWGMR